MGGVAPSPEHAEIEGVVSDCVEIERSIQLDVEAAGVRDRLALGEAIGVVRRSERAEQKSIEGIAGVNVQIAEEGLAGLGAGACPCQAHDGRK